MIFGELDYRMSVVERWNVTVTIRKQSIAEHSFNVAIISQRIATQWFGVMDPNVLLDIYKRALGHDAPESITGDPPSYMKRYIDEESVIADFELDQTFDIGSKWEIVPIIVKIADYIDALIFLQMEMSLGNRTVVSLFHKTETRFAKYLNEIAKTNSKTWGTVYESYIKLVRLPLFGEDGQFRAEQIWPLK